MPPLVVRYGIPQPTPMIEVGVPPLFKTESITSLNLNEFPIADMPSGGMSGRISPSEMMMIQTCRPTRMVWKRPDGSVMADLQGEYSFVGRFPWEIKETGMYRTEIHYRGELQGFVEYEVV